MEKLIDLLMEYGFTILALLALTVFVIHMIIKWFKESNNTQRQMVAKWLIVACLKVEKDLGSKTGQLKLLTVYTMFTDKFKWLSKIISFELFSSMVDEALVTVRKMIETNPQVKELVEEK